MPEAASKKPGERLVDGSFVRGLGQSGRIHRLLKLITALQSGRSYGASELADRLGVCRRTVFRYLDILRSVGMEYQHDREAGRYRAEPGSLLRPVDLSLAEALALLLASRGTNGAREEPSVPLLQAAGSAALKIESVLPGPVQRYCQSLMGKMRIRPSAMARHDHSSSFFELIQRAIHRKQKVKMVYRSFTEGEAIETILSAYRLVFCQRAWYVVGHSSLHESVRTFKLLRVYQARILKKLYVEDESFDLERYFGNAWFMIPEGRLYRVALHFSRKVAGNVAEVLWHKSQQIERLHDGSMIFRVTVDGLTEISWWILGYGAEVEVKGPAVLRNRMAKMVGQMAAIYRRKNKQCV